MNIENNVKHNIKIVNDLFNRLIQEKEIHPLELDILKDALKNLYLEVICVGNSFENNEECINSIEEKEKSFEQKDIIPPFIDEKIEKTEDIKLDDEKFEPTLENFVPREENFEQKIEQVETNPSEENFEKFEEQLETINIQKNVVINEEIDLFAPISEEPQIVETKIDFAFENTQQEIIEKEDINCETIVEENTPESKPLSIAEKLSTVSSTIADTIAQEPKSTIADKVARDKITNIKLAIGINDKFFFINRLFDGDVDFYNETIEKFNNFTSLNDAKILLQLLINKYNWDFEDEAFKKFEDIVERRY